MNELSLALTCNEKKITDAPEPKEVLLPLAGFDKGKKYPKIKEGARVITGEQLIPGVYSTVTGFIKSIEPLALAQGDFTALRIEVSDKEEFDPDVKEELDFLKMDPPEILSKLNRANLGFSELPGDIETVIVSAVDTEPLAQVNPQILRENKEVILKGLELIKHLTSAKKVIFAVPESLFSLGSEAAGDKADIFCVKPVYPNGLPEILLRDITNKYDPGKSAVIKLEKLTASVLSLQKGKSFVHKVVSVVDKKGAGNYRVRIGTPIKELLKDNELKENDKVVIGGPFKGDACYSIDIPITHDVDLLYVQDADDVFFNENNQCINCGTCVRVCPVDLDVNLLCRYSEFSIFEKCLEMDVKSCIECGLCAYYCPSGRSLVQFIRLAKKEVENIEREENIEGEEVS